MNTKTHTNSGFAKNEPHLPCNKVNAVDEMPTLYGLLARLQEEVERGYDLHYSVKNQLNRIIGYEPDLLDKSRPDNADNNNKEMISYINLLEELVVRLRVLNDRNESQLYRLQISVG